MFERDTGCPGPQSNGYPREPVKRDRLHPRVRPGPPIGNPLPAQSPNTPALRANPYPEVTDPICRLPLPTLFYRPETVNPRDLLQKSVRSEPDTRSTQLYAPARLFTDAPSQLDAEKVLHSCPAYGAPRHTLGLFRGALDSSIPRN